VFFYLFFFFFLFFFLFFNFFFFFFCFFLPFVFLPKSGPPPEREGHSDPYSFAMKTVRFFCSIVRESNQAAVRPPVGTFHCSPVRPPILLLRCLGPESFFCLAEFVSMSSLISARILLGTSPFNQAGLFSDRARGCGMVLYYLMEYFGLALQV